MATTTSRKYSLPKMNMPSMNLHLPNVGLKRPSFTKRPSLKSPFKSLGSRMSSGMSKMRSWRYRVTGKKSSVTEKVDEDEGDENDYEGVDKLPPPSERKAGFRGSKPVRVTSRHQKQREYESFMRSRGGSQSSFSSGHRLTKNYSSSSEDSQEEQESSFLDPEEERRLSNARRRGEARDYEAFMGGYNPEERRKESHARASSQTQTLDALERRIDSPSAFLDKQEQKRLDRAGKWSRAHSTARKTPLRRTRSSMSTTQPIATTGARKPYKYLGGRDTSTSNASSRELPRLPPPHLRRPQSMSRVTPKTSHKPASTQQANHKPRKTSLGSRPKPRTKAKPALTTTTVHVGASGSNGQTQKPRQVVRVGKQETTKRRPSWLSAVRQGKAEKPNVREKIQQRERNQEAAVEAMRQRRLANQELVRKKREAAQRREQRLTGRNQQATTPAVKRSPTQQKANPKPKLQGRTLSAPTVAKPQQLPQTTRSRFEGKAAPTPRVSQVEKGNAKAGQQSAQEPGLFEMIQKRVYEFWDPQAAENSTGSSQAKAKEPEKEPEQQPEVKPKRSTPKKPSVQTKFANRRDPVQPKTVPTKPPPLEAPRTVSKPSFDTSFLKPVPKETAREDTSNEGWKPPEYEKQVSKEEEEGSGTRVASWRDGDNDRKSSSLGKEGMAAFKAMLEKNYSSQIIAGSVAGTAPVGGAAEPKPLSSSGSNKPKEGTPYLDKIMGSSGRKPKVFKVKKVTLRKLKPGSEELECYQRMRNYGLPDGPIMNKMEMDGIDPSCVELLESKAEEDTQTQGGTTAVVMTAIPAKEPVKEQAKAPAKVQAKPMSRPASRRRQRGGGKAKSGIKGTVKNMRRAKSSSPRNSGQSTRASRNFSAGVGGRMALFEQLGQAHKEKMARNPFAGGHDPRATGIKRGDDGYGQGNQEVYNRGKQAMQEGVDRMMQELRAIAKPNGNGVLCTTFGELFEHYANISTNLVQYLLKARKQKIIDFEGEYLRQGRDDHVVIRLL